jgi:hypothetical protein
MIQAKQQTETAFFIPEPRRKTAIKIPPKIVWEVPPPNFEIPDEPMDNFDQSLFAEALRDALYSNQCLSTNPLYATSLAVCAKVDGRTITKAPDWFYVPDVHLIEENRHSYTPYADGKLPTIVMEFLSDNDRREYDNSPDYPYGKWYFYETILKIPWYAIFNSDKGKLEVYHLERGRYKEQIGGKEGLYWIDSMKLFLGIWKGFKKNVDINRKIFWLRWWDEGGNPLPWEYEKAKEALKKSDAEKRKALKKAETEKKKAEKAETEKRDALAKAEKAETEKRDALKKAEIEKKKAEKAETEKRDALEKAEIEKQDALQIANRQMAKQMLQAHLEIVLIQQITGLDETEILLLDYQVFFA